MIGKAAKAFPMMTVKTAMPTQYTTTEPSREPEGRIALVMVPTA